MCGHFLVRSSRARGPHFRALSDVRGPVYHSECGNGRCQMLAGPGPSVGREARFPSLDRSLSDVRETGPVSYSVSLWDRPLSDVRGTGPGQLLARPGPRPGPPPASLVIRKVRSSGTPEERADPRRARGARGALLRGRELPGARGARGYLRRAPGWQGSSLAASGRTGPTRLHVTQHLRMLRYVQSWVGYIF